MGTKSVPRWFPNSKKEAAKEKDENSDKHPQATKNNHSHEGNFKWLSVF
jgi:hypothetical protein